MKKLAIFVTVFFAIAHIYAQKIGVVDTNYILSKLPQYKEAESRLNSQISQWQSDLQKLQADYERKREAFENEKVLLVGEQLKMREKEVVDMEASIRNTIGIVKYRKKFCFSTDFFIVSIYPLLHLSYCNISPSAY